MSVVKFIGKSKSEIPKEEPKCRVYQRALKRLLDTGVGDSSNICNIQKLVFINVKLVVTTVRYASDQDNILLQM